MLVDYKSKLKGETSVFMAPLQSFNNCLSEYAFAGGVCIISGKITVVLMTPYDWYKPAIIELLTIFIKKLQKPYYG